MIQTNGTAHQAVLGQAGDVPQAASPLEGWQPRQVLADREYDADNLRRHIAAPVGEPAIPGRRHQRVPIDYNRELYRTRNVVERSIDWLKQGRRITTCYEKTAASYLSFVMFAAVRNGMRLS